MAALQSRRAAQAFCFVMCSQFFLRALALVEAESTASFAGLRRFDCQLLDGHPTSDTYACNT